VSAQVDAGASEILGGVCQGGGVLVEPIAAEELERKDTI
jgi:hypothetical protein